MGEREVNVPRGRFRVALGRAQPTPFGGYHPHQQLTTTSLRVRGRGGICVAPRVAMVLAPSRQESLATAITRLLAATIASPYCSR